MADVMTVYKNQIKKDSKKKIGNVNGVPVFALMTKGGLNMVLMAKATGPKILGMGPHIAIARKTAQINEPDLFLEELSKAEEIPASSFQHLVPHYLNLVTKMNEKMEDNG